MVAEDSWSPELYRLKEHSIDIQSFGSVKVDKDRDWYILKDWEYDHFTKTPFAVQKNRLHMALADKGTESFWKTLNLLVRAWQIFWKMSLERILHQITQKKWRNWLRYKSYHYITNEPANPNLFLFFCYDDGKCEKQPLFDLLLRPNCLREEQDQCAKKSASESIHMFVCDPRDSEAVNVL